MLVLVPVFLRYPAGLFKVYHPFWKICHVHCSRYAKENSLRAMLEFRSPIKMYP